MNEENDDDEEKSRRRRIEGRRGEGNEELMKR